MSSSARPELRQTRALFLLLGSLLGASAPAAAEPSLPEAGHPGLPPQTRPLRSGAAGDYGRLDGALDLEMAALGHLARGDGLQLGLRAGAEYFATAGVWLNGSLGTRKGTAHRLAAGLSLKPVFLPRWALDVHHARATPDLILDSLSLEVGAFTEEAEAVTHRGLLLGVGLGIPLFGSAAGPWLGLRGLLEWPDDLALSSRGAMQLSLGWHWLLEPALL